MVARASVYFGLPFKRVLRSEKGRPPVTHALQCGHGRGHPRLDDGGGGNQGGNGEN